MLYGEIYPDYGYEEKLYLDYPKIRSLFEDIVDRVYSKKDILDCEELHSDLDKIGGMLGVYVPDREVHLRLGDAFEEYLEDILMVNLDKLAFSQLYLFEDQRLAYEFLKKQWHDLPSINEVVSLLDIEKFCYSEFYARNHRRLKNVY